MKKSFLKITATAVVATIALTLGVVGVSADNSTTGTAEPSSAVMAGAWENVTLRAAAAEPDSVVVTDEMLARYDEYYKAYEQAYYKARNEEFEKINNGIITDSMDKAQIENMLAYQHQIPAIASEKATEECIALGYTDEVALKLHPIIGYDYDKYGGSFTVSSIENTSLSFVAPPYDFSCSIQNGRVGSMTAVSGYKGNFKQVSVFLTYSDGTIKRKSAGDNEQTVSAEPATSSGYITKAEYFFYLYAGTESSSDLYEVAQVTLIRG